MTHRPAPIAHPAASRPSRPTSTAPTRAAGRRCVLHVEDHPVNVLLMEAVFDTRPDVDLVVACSVAEALRVAASLRPVLLLLDLGLPDGDGAALLRVLRTLPGCREARAVAVSADVLADTDTAGFDERWDKPLDLPRVRDRVDALLGPVAGTADERRPQAQALPFGTGAFAASGPWPAGKRIRIPSPGEH